jgi:hypothetical protein
MRVQIPVYTDRWMMGDRYGDVVRVVKRKIYDKTFTREELREVAYVRLDKSGKVRKFMLDDCQVV